MINKQNQRVTITLPKWIVEEYDKKDYQLSQLVTLLLKNHLSYLEKKKVFDPQEQQQELKKAGFDSLEDFKKEKDLLFKEILQK